MCVVGGCGGGGEEGYRFLLVSYCFLQRMVLAWVGGQAQTKATSGCPTRRSVAS